MYEQKDLVVALINRILLKHEKDLRNFIQFPS
jgi:hypothetical protein